MNPLYQEDDGLNSIHSPSSLVGKPVRGDAEDSPHPATPDSPTTAGDRNSVRSSGYGSKENDDSASDISNVAHEDVEPDYESDREFHPHRLGRRQQTLSSNTNVTLPKNDNNTLKDSSNFSNGVNTELILAASNLTKDGDLSSDSVPFKESHEKSSSKDHTHEVDGVTSSTNEMIEVTRHDLFGYDCHPVLYDKNPRYVQSVRVGVRRVRSLETVQEVRDETDSPRNVSKNEANIVPTPVWPGMSQIAQTLQRQSDRINLRRQNAHKKIVRASSLELRPRGQVIRFNPLVSVLTQNSRYITSISVSPRPPPTFKPITENWSSDKVTHFTNSNSNNHATIHEENSHSVNNISPEEERLARYFSKGQQINIHGSGISALTEYPIMSLQPDSLVNEDTLRMMTYPDYDLDGDDAQPSPILPNADLHHDLGQVMYTRGLYATLNRNSVLLNEEIYIKPPFKTRKILSNKNFENRKTNSNVKKKGIDTVRDLWEKTGLKTNGRKLLVDIEDVMNERHETLSGKTSSKYSEEIYVSTENNVEFNRNYKNSTSNESSNDRIKSNINTNKHEKLSRKNSVCIKCSYECETSKICSSLSVRGSGQSKESANNSKSRSKDTSSIYSISERAENYRYKEMSSSKGISFDMFGIDNFAFVDDTGNRSKATDVMNNKRKINLSENDGSSVTSPASESSASHMRPGNQEHEYSELSLVVSEKTNASRNDADDSNSLRNSSNVSFLKKIGTKHPHAAYRVENEKTRLTSWNQGATQPTNRFDREQVRRCTV